MAHRSPFRATRVARYRRTLSAVSLVSALALAGAACSTTIETSADEPPGVTPTAVPTPDSTAAEGASPDTSERVPNPESARPGREVPPLVLPTTPPGSDDAWAALRNDLDRFITDDQRADGVPWPDLRNPDPVAVYRSCAEFQTWMSQHNATPSLVEAYTAPASPERGWDLNLFADYRLLDILATPSDPPYEMRVVGVVHPAATDITDALLADVPDGSVAVVYYDSVGVSELVHPDGTVFGTDTGWTDLGPWVAIMAPTEVGWQVWWDELTDVPPPGLDEERGAPTETDPRRDV